MANSSENGDLVKALYDAIASGLETKVSELIARGVDVNSTECNSDTLVLAPLHLATGGVSVMYCGYNCRPDITDTLLQVSDLVAQGVDVNSSVSDGDTHILAPLHLATGGVYCNVCTCSVLYCGYNCRPDITDLLLKANADPNLRTRGKGFTSLHLIAGPLWDMMSRARECKTFNLQEVMRHTWYRYKYHIETSKVQIFKLLLRAGADLNARTVDGETPLMTATLAQYSMFIHMLLWEGASVECKLKSQVAPPYCRNVLELALATNNVDSVRVLFEAGAQDIVLDHLNEIEPEIKLNGEIRELICQLQSERPRRLKVLCRAAIRSVLGSNIRRDVSRVGLPKSLQEYVLMKSQLKDENDFLMELHEIS